MERRLTYAEKGKGVVLELKEPTVRRIRAPSLDTTLLVRDNELTLIGRLTNPKEQRIWNLIPSLPRKWNIQGRADDLQSVLDNRPYHFGYWMIILQCWEPIISDSFPSLIPFWVRIKGLPLHYWHETMVRNIGKELGTYEAHMITKTSAKVRVMVNGLKPIIKETIIEFDSGEECKITLEYDKLENHCSLCGLLSHQASRCPTLLVEEVHKRDQSRASRGVATEALNQSAEEKQEDPSYHSQAFHQRVDRHGRSFGNRISTKQTRVPPPQQDNTSLVIRNQPSQPSQERKALQIKKTSRSWREKSHHDRPKEGMFPPYTKERAVPIRNYQRGKDLFSSRSEGQWRPKQFRNMEEHPPPSTLRHKIDDQR